MSKFNSTVYTHKNGSKSLIEERTNWHEPNENNELVALGKQPFRVIAQINLKAQENQDLFGELFDNTMKAVITSQYGKLEIVGFPDSWKDESQVIDLNNLKAVSLLEESDETIKDFTYRTNDPETGHATFAGVSEGIWYRVNTLLSPLGVEVGRIVEK